MPKSLAVFPGSFDPPTNGHVDIVLRTLKLFETVRVAVIANPAKSVLFSLSERVDLMKEVFADLSDRVFVDSFSGLLVHYVRDVQGTAIIRGLRAISDYDYEAQMALMNKSLYPEAETIFLITQEKNSYISSTLVRQVASLGGSVKDLVPPVVLTALNRKLAHPWNL